MKRIFLFLALVSSAFSQVKISELPSASTLGGTEVFPTVQSATTKKATAAQIAEYAQSVAAATLAPIASPTFTGTVTIPAGASIDGFLTTSAAASAYQPLAAPLTAFAGLANAGGVLANNGSGSLSYIGVGVGGNGNSDSGKIVQYFSNGGIYSTVRTRTYDSGGGSSYNETNSLGMLYYNGTNSIGLRWPTLTGNRIITLPNASGTVALVSGDLGTPSSVTLTNASGLPVATGISGLGTGVATALAINVGSAGAPVVNGGALGTPSSGTGTNITGIPPANITGTAAVLGANTFTGNQTINNGTNIVQVNLIGTDRSGTLSLNAFGNGLKTSGLHEIDNGFIILTSSNTTYRHWRLMSDAATVENVLQLGEDSAGPPSQTFKSSDGSGTNINGSNLTLASGNSTGSGTSVLIFATPTPGASGATVRTSSERMRLSSAGLTIGVSGTPIAAVISAVATKDFDLTAVTVEDQTMTVTGAAVGDVVELGVPHGSVTTTSQFTAWVSAADTVTIRCTTQVVGENPASGSFRATITKH